jgi:internalin A
MEYQFLHDGVMRQMICELGKRAGPDAVYWRYGCCYYEGNTGVSVRLDCLESNATSTEQRGVVVIETAGGRAHELTLHLVNSILDGIPVPQKPSVRWRRQLTSKTESVERKRGESGRQTPFALVPAAQPSRDAKPRAYISYAWGGESERVVDDLEGVLADLVDLRRDRRAMRPGDNIREFEEEIGRGALVVCVLSRKYLESSDCCRELTFLYEHDMRNGQAFSRRVVPVVLDGVAIGSQNERLSHLEKWSEARQRLEDAVRRYGPARAGQSTTRELQDIAAFELSLVDALTWLAEVLMPRGVRQIGRTDYAPVRELVERRLAERNSSWSRVEHRAPDGSE